LLNLSIEDMNKEMAIRYPEDLAFFENTGLAKIIQDAYVHNKPTAVNEMARFANFYQLDPTGQAPMATFIINHLFVRIDETNTQMQSLTDYSDVGKKFTIDHVIRNTLTQHTDLVDVMKSLVFEMDFPPEYKSYIKSELQIKCDLLKAQANASLRRYANFMKPCELLDVSNEDLSELELLIEKGTDFSDGLTGEIKYPSSSIKNAPELDNLQIGNYCSQTKPDWTHTSAYQNIPNMFYQPTDSSLLLPVSRIISPPSPSVIIVEIPNNLSKDTLDSDLNEDQDEDDFYDAQDQNDDQDDDYYDAPSKFKNSNQVDPDQNDDQDDDDDFYDAQDQNDAQDDYDDYYDAPTTFQDSGQVNQGDDNFYDARSTFQDSDQVDQGEDSFHDASSTFQDSGPVEDL
jgi:hypothetical protein